MSNDLRGPDNEESGEAYVNWPALYREMDRQGLDAFIAATPEGTYYLSGIHVELNRWFRDRLAMVVVTRSGSATLIVCSIEERLARSVAWLPDIRTFLHYIESVPALVRVLEERNLGAARLGFEARFWSTSFYRRVAHGLPKAQLIPADQVIDSTRALKTAAEIARLQAAARLSDAAAVRAWERSRSPLSEHDLSIAMTLEMLADGAERVAYLSVASGSRTRMVGTRATDNLLEKGDLVLAEFGVVHEAYWSNLGRMGVVGQPTVRQSELYKLLRRVQRDVIDRMKPGVACNELYAFARDTYLDGGVDGVSPSIGHSMPRARGHEPPVLHPFDTTLLENGMVFAVAPSFVLGAERYQIKDLVHVTEVGAKVLSDRWDTSDLFVFR